MTQHNVVDENTAEVTKTPVIKMEKSLLPKKEMAERKVKGVKM
jgi:hypothetical protein